MTTPIPSSSARAQVGCTEGGGGAPSSSSSESLPPLSSDAVFALEGDRAKFSTSTAECTSLKIAPSGRVVVAGFTDGTLRLFPVGGVLVVPPNNNSKAQEPRPPRKATAAPTPPAIPSSKASVTIPRSGSASEEPYVLTESAGVNSTKKSASSSNSRRKVQASSHVAAQIVSKGVHTSLLMDVDVTPDGLWAFAGVLRGSMELVALHIGHLEAAMDEYYNERGGAAASSAAAAPCCWSDWMDTLTVYKQVDAKLRGFGACTCLDNERYLLLTGKAIKNIHIWSFTPPKNDHDHPVWTQLYDTQTNGNTIKWLSFHVNPTTGSLSALSKSDGQKLRVWDLTLEQQEKDSDPNNIERPRPSRPPFVDVANTEGMLGVAGGYAICGGASESMYHQVGLVNLNSVGDLQSPYNHTELALPSSPPESGGLGGGGGGGSVAGDSSGNAPPQQQQQQPRRRQQRGDLKSVERVAGIEGQAILELSDGNLVQFQSKPGQGQPVLTMLGRALPPGFSRQIGVARIASCGLAVAATAVFNPAKGKGWIRLWPMECVQQRLNDPYRGDWGYRGVPTVPKPSRGKPSPTVARQRKSPTEGPASKASEPPASVVKALAPPTAAASVQKENRPQPVADVSIVTPRFTEAAAPNTNSITSQSISVGRPYRVSMEPVQLDRTIDDTPKARERVVDAKHQNTEEQRQLDRAVDSRGRTGSTAQDGSTRKKKKRKSVDGRAFVSAVGSDSAKSTSPLEPPSSVAKRGKLSAFVSVEARQEAASALVSMASCPTAPTHPSGEIRRGNNAGTRASVAPLVATQIGDGTLSTVRFKSPMRRDKKRINKVEVDLSTQTRILDECKRRRNVLDQLIKDCPVRRSPLLEENHLKSATSTSLVERHGDQRRKLLLSQGAAYDRLIKSILNRAAQTLDLIMQSPTPTTLNEAREMWTNETHWFEQLVEETAQRHALENDGLQSRQMWERLSTSNMGSTPSLAGDDGLPSRAEVHSILLHLKDCIPQFCD